MKVEAGECCREGRGCVRKEWCWTAYRQHAAGRGAAWPPCCAPCVCGCLPGPSGFGTAHLRGGRPCHATQHTHKPSTSQSAVRIRVQGFKASVSTGLGFRALGLKKVSTGGRGRQAVVGRP